MKWFHNNSRSASTDAIGVLHSHGAIRNDARRVRDVLEYPKEMIGV